MKIKSALVSGRKGGLKGKYEEIYKDAEVWLYKKSDGVHSIIYKHVKNKIKGKEVLDVGCGAGRLAIMMAFSAKNVDAFDFSRTAVEIARKNASCSGVSNVNFSVDELEKFKPKGGKKYDLITLIGVLEHVKNPAVVLRRLNKLLNKNGTLVVACPNFLNFRGYTYMTLLKLFELPMSLADIRQVDYSDMEKWSKATGFKLEKTIGALFDFAWGEKAVNDMVKRVPAAAKDKKIKFQLNYQDYNSWLNSSLDKNKRYLEFLEEKGFLKRIDRQLKIKFSMADDIEEKLLARMSDYMNEDLGKDPYYSDVAPICYQGGESIYLLKKL